MSEVKAFVVLVSSALLLSGCARPAKDVPHSPPVVGPPAQQVAGARVYRVVAEESLLTILVYRGGALARAGHNHVIASRHLSGDVQLAADVTRSAFTLRLPVALLTIDEPALRGAAGPEFAAEVPETARQGTRSNMLGEDLLHAARYPEITITSERVQVVPGGLDVRLRIALKDGATLLQIPVRLEAKGGELLASGERKLRQSELGLTPFSALLGALQVQDEMQIRFRVLARG